jgi:spore maturation protein CgeB
MYSSFLKVTSFYKEFLDDYYRSYPHIIEKDYAEQFNHLMAQGYGYSDFFPKYIQKNYSIESREIIHNAGHLQGAWARENGSRAEGDDLLMEQIRTMQPEVLFIQDSINFDAAYIDRIREEVKSVRLLIGHCCAPYTPRNIESFSRYNLMLTCSEKFLMEFRKQKIKCYLFPHAFEASLVPEHSSQTPRKNDIIFIGSLLYRSDFHRKRITYVEEILNNRLPLHIYGIIEEDPWYLLKIKQASYLFVRAMDSAGIKVFQNNRSVRKIAQLKEMPKKSRYSELIKENLRRDMLFGKQMLIEMARHSAGFNLHGDVAGDYAANVRMFEVAGVGTLLITDHKKNIRELYEPDLEILTYSGIEECIEKLKWAIDHPEEAGRIAAAGQKRTLLDHSVERRVDLLYEIMKKEFMFL